jgi:hypothetical protein
MSASKGQYTAETVALVEGDIRTIRLTEDGLLMVDATVSASPGAATSANQTTMIGHLDGVETTLTAIDGRVDGLETLITATNASLELLKQPNRALAVTPSDATDITATATKGLLVTVTGNVNVTYAGDSTAVALGTWPAGSYIPGALERVNAATTATVVSLYGP